MRILFYLWASPNSIIGVLIGMIGILSGGKAQWKRGCVEFYGGFVTWLLENMATHGIWAMTLGHTIIGQNANALQIARDHEQVHVKQYERWGPFFIPVYLLCSGYLWLLKKDCYRGNPFEVEAYDISDPQQVRWSDPKDNDE